jgi:DHA2 family multidrug resistance protein
MSSADGSSAFVQVPHRRLITFGVVLSTALQSVDATIANVALPSMQGPLGAARDSITWVLTSYIVAMAIVTPLTGWLAGRLGNRNLLLAAVSLFTLFSALCGLAGTLEQMVLFRFLQGAAGAALVPLAQSTLLDINPREKQPAAMALWGMAMTGVQAAGPTLGGWLTENYSWRWVFLINVPLGIIAFLVLLAFMSPAGRPARRPLDFFGFSSLSVAVAALQLMLDRGEQLDWFSSPEIVLEAVIGGLALWTFLVHSFTAKRTFFNPRLFADRNYTAGVLMTFVVFIIFMGTMSLVPPMLQQLYHLPVMTVAYLMMPRSFSMLIGMIIVTRLSSRMDQRFLVIAGLLLLSVSLWWMSGFTLAMGTAPIAWSAFLQGFGIAFIFMPMNITSYATLDPVLRAEATAFTALIRNIAQAIGISVVTVLLSTNSQVVHASMASHVAGLFQWLAVPAYNRFLTNPMGLLPAINGEVTRAASMVAYLDDFYFMFWMCIAVMPLVMLIRPVRARAGAKAEPAHAALVD